MPINDRLKNKNKGITFVSNIGEVGIRGDKEESLENDIALLGKKFNKTLKYLDRKWRTNVPDERSNIISQNKDKSGEEPNSGKGTQCLESEDYGDFRE